MKHVHRTALVSYRAAEMLALVADVAAYPAFLPWCERGEVLQAEGDGNLARLHLAIAGVRHHFTTRNIIVPGRSLQMQLVDGPFSVLEGHWAFTPLQAPGAPPEAAEACRIEFDLRYAFAGRALELVVSPVFDHIANTFVDAFVRRARQVYGER